MTGAYGGQVSLADFSMKYVAEAAEKCFKNYPFPSKAKNYQTDFAMIKGDFPNMTEKDILKNEKTIEKYYDINLDYEVLQLLKKTKTPITKKEKRLTPRVGLGEDDDHVVVPSGSGGSGSSYDPNCTMKMPGRGSYSSSVCMGLKLFFKGWDIVFNSRILYAAQTSKTEAEREFGGGADNARDAKRHIYVSALLALNYYSNSKATRLQFAKDVGDANEECGDNYVDASAMDDHNNTVGRELFNKESYYSAVSSYLIVPSKSTLKRRAIKLVDNQGVYKKVPTPFDKTLQDTICYRKHLINQADSSKPVYLKPHYTLTDTDLVCRNKTVTISINDHDKNIDASTPVVWTYDTNKVEKVSNTQKSITIKAKTGSYSRQGWVKASFNGKNLIEYFDVEPSVSINIKYLNTPAHYGRMVDVTVVKGKPPYQFYYKGSLIKTSSNRTETIRVDKNGGIIEVTATNACGSRMRASNIVQSAGSGSGMPPI